MLPYVHHENSPHEFLDYCSFLSAIFFPTIITSKCATFIQKFVVSSTSPNIELDLQDSLFLPHLDSPKERP